MLRFSHTPDGTPLSVSYAGNIYYYITNLQGDVVALVDSEGDTVVEYTYDAWGNLLSTTGSMANTLGLRNPLRYRGYVYDRETGLYYLQSRYYNPETGRFINADAYTSTGQGLLGNNMFAYCGNNPVNFEDPAGTRHMLANKLPGGTRYIHNQTNDFYGELSFGLTTISHSGCGPVAAYNALKIAGKYDTEMEDIIVDYSENGNVPLGGIIGTSPYACAEYLDRQGYTVFMTNDVATYAPLAETAAACVLYYWYDNSDGFPYVGHHFVAFSQKNGVGKYYNVYSNSTAATTFYGDCDDFVRANGFCLPVLILVYPE